MKKMFALLCGAIAMMFAPLAAMAAPGDGTSTLPQKAEFGLDIASLGQSPISMSGNTTLHANTWARTAMATTWPLPEMTIAAYPTVMVSTGDASGITPDNWAMATWPLPDSPMNSFAMAATSGGSGSGFLKGGGGVATSEGWGGLTAHT